MNLQYNFPQRNFFREIQKFGHVMVSAWFISRIVWNFLSDFFLLIQQLWKMVMFKICIFRNLLKFFPMVFSYYCILLQSVFCGSSLLNELSFVLWFIPKPEKHSVAAGDDSVASHCLVEFFTSLLGQFVRSVQIFYFMWSLFSYSSCYLDGIYCCPFFPSVLPGCLPCIWEFFCVHACS